MNPNNSQPSNPSNTPALAGFSLDLVVTGHHQDLPREITLESRNGRAVFFDVPASAVWRTGAIEDHSVCFVPLAAGGRCFLDGFEIPADGFGISPSGRGALFRSESAGIFAVMWISNQATQAFFDPHGFHAMHKIRAFSRVEIPSALRDFPNGASGNSNSPGHALEIESAMLQALQAGWNSPEMHSIPRRSTCRPGIVHAIWNGIRSAPTEESSLEEWSRRVGASMRTVECAFRQITGLAPVKFLRSVRFTMSRELLRNNRVKTVSQAAMGCGLMHLGRFSIDYRLKFGEHPSETLAKARAGTSRNPEPAP